jgi:hypothetical protein
MRPVMIAKGSDRKSFERSSATRPSEAGRPDGSPLHRIYRREERLEAAYARRYRATWKVGA